MLGNGCMWKNQCKYKANSFHRKNYCDSDTGWRKCPYTVGNDGNKEVERRYNSHKTSESNARMGQIFILIVIIVAIISRFF